jgi:predicted signal transduction protein with EAL and GGDEF domain
MDTVARIGGDEFTVILSQVKEADFISKVADKILQEIAKPIILKNKALYITGSLGIVIYPDDARDLGDLVKKADLAMYKAKENGRNNYQFYSEELQTRANKQLILISDLHRALDKKEFMVYYQPLMNLKDNKVVFGFEALARWNHPELGLVLPKDFIELAEKVGLIGLLGDFILENACGQYVRWQEAGFSGLQLAVNISTWQLYQENIGDRINHILKKTRMPADKLIFEITESALAKDPQKVLKILKQIKSYKIGLAIDDFGTGYSSLEYLHQFPVDLIKIDKKFTKEMVNNKIEESIVKAIIALAKGLNADVLAEGVETEQQKDKLLSLGCHLMQGYLFGKPISAEKQTLNFQENKKERE